MKVKMPSIRRPKYGLMAALLAVSAITPALTLSKVSAAQITERSIQMSSAAPSATSVSYKVSFKTATTSVVQAIVVDFCSSDGTSSPIIGADCTTPTGLSLSGAAVGGGVTGLSGTGWNTPTVTVQSGNGNHSVAIKNASGTSTTAPATVDFTITGITNPSDANKTFYARILTYTTTGGADIYTSAVPGSHVDDGGIALSTAALVSVSGTVQETLTFCVASVAISTSCAVNATGNPPTLELGTGTPKVLDANAAYTGSIYSEISTNAANGATIRMKTNNDCGGLKRAGASSCEIGAVGTTPAGLTGGAQFGMRATTAGGLNAQAPYNDASNYGMDDQSAENVTTTYGDVVALSSSVLNAVDTTYTFAARAGNTTPAGVYSANLTLIAVGSY